MSRLKYCKEELLPVIDPVEYYQQEFPEWDGQEQTKVICPKHNDTDASLSIDPQTGAFWCFGCRWKGTWVGGFHTDVHHEGKWAESIRDLYRRYIRPVIDPDQLEKTRALLHQDDHVKAILARVRGWTEDTLELHKLGWHPKLRRVVIPIMNPGGMILDFRYHDSIKAAPLVKGKRVGTLAPKREAGGRSGDWFPFSPWLNPLQQRAIWLVEGESDAILATQDGLNCLTVTGGVGQWAELPHKKLACLQAKDVVMCFDDDEAGIKAMAALAERLAAVEVRSLKAVKLPMGNDITEFFMEYDGSAAQLKQIAAATPYLFKPKNRVSKRIPLAESSEAQYIGQSIESDLLVTTKWHSPVVIPKRLVFNCINDDRCANCPCDDGEPKEHVITRDDPALLDWIYTRDLEKGIKAEYKLGRKCNLTVDVLEHQTLEPITMVPALSTSRSSNEAAYVERAGYFLGHGLEANQTYRVKATPMVHPRSRESIILVEEARGTHDSLTNFSFKPEEVARLRSVFAGKPADVVRRVCSYLSANHTKIYGRWELHALVDLCFHSPLSFVFADTEVPKGSMEILLLGDARTGKGQTAEGISKVYDLGCVVSGESASFMGLVGGAKSSDRGFVLQWGRIPTNHGRLVIVDEFSGFRDLQKMSRIRSEGVAELDKGGIHAKTGANTRIIWIANGRDGRDMASFSSGVYCIKDLVKADEDIARFDAAICLAKGEVDIAQINAIHNGVVREKFNEDDLRKVVLWVWSRKRDQVMFSRSATRAIFSAANHLAKRYSPSIPLIQGENARFKVAKMSAAVAARCFSTDDTGTFLQVREEHVKTAVSFIHKLYDSPTMGYRDYSELELGSSKLLHEEMLTKFFQRKGPAMRQVLLDGMLQMDEFSIREIMDLTQTEIMGAKRVTQLLIQCQAVRPVAGGLYKKRPDFIKLLRKLKDELKDVDVEASPHFDKDEGVVPF